MAHRCFIRDRGTENTAVIMIHGILSTPRHFDWLVSQVPDDLAVYNILLEGHGGSVSDFSKASMKKWKAQVEQCIRHQEHCGRRAVLVGHSLGALLALDAQRKHTCVESLLLLNVPLCPAVKPEMMGRSLRFAFGRVRREDPLDLQCYEDLGVVLEPYLWKYIGWIPNFISLLTLAAHCRGKVSDLQKPCAVFLGEQDVLVSIRTKKWLQNVPAVRLHMLPQGTHFGYSSQEQTLISQALFRLLERE